MNVKEISLEELFKQLFPNSTKEVVKEEKPSRETYSIRELLDMKAFDKLSENGFGMSMTYEVTFGLKYNVFCESRSVSLIELQNNRCEIVYDSGKQYPLTDFNKKVFKIFKRI